MLYSLFLNDQFTFELINYPLWKGPAAYCKRANTDTTGADEKFFDYGVRGSDMKFVEIRGH